MHGNALHYASRQTHSIGNLLVEALGLVLDKHLIHKVGLRGNAEHLITLPHMRNARRATHKNMLGTRSGARQQKAMQLKHTGLPGFERHTLPLPKEWAMAREIFEHSLRSSAVVCGCQDTCIHKGESVNKTVCVCVSVCLCVCACVRYCTAALCAFHSSYDNASLELW